MDRERHGGRNAALLCRRGLLAALAAGASSLLRIDLGSASEEPELPLNVQIRLLSLVARHDRNYAARARPVARVIVVRTRHPRSERSSVLLETVLRQLKLLGGVPQEATVHDFVSAERLAAFSKELQAAIIYLTPGLSAEMPAIAAALEGQSVVTVSTVASYVERGAVFGFQLGEGRPRLILNLAQARKQHVDFAEEALKLMEIVK